MTGLCPLPPSPKHWLEPNTLMGVAQASTKEEAAQIMANQVLRAGKGNPAPAPKPDTGGGTTVRTSTVLLVAGAAGTLYGGYKYTVYRVGQDKVDRCIALVRQPPCPNPHHTAMQKLRIGR